MQNNKKRRATEASQSSFFYILMHKWMSNWGRFFSVVFVEKCRKSPKGNAKRDGFLGEMRILLLYKNPQNFLRVRRLFAKARNISRDCVVRDKDRPSVTICFSFDAHDLFIILLQRTR